MWRIGAVLCAAVLIVLISRSRVARSAPRASPTDEEIATEARSLAVVLDGIFDQVENLLHEGVTTRAIDELVKRQIAAAGVKSSFVGYHGYPAYCSTSINEEVVDTLPSDRLLRNGDLLKVQVGISGKRTHAIRGWTYAIGPVSDDDRRLMETGRAALKRAIAATRTGARTGDIGSAIQTTVENAGYNVARSFIGYRLGEYPHVDPPIPGFGTAGHGARLKRHWLLALFAIVHAGSPECVERERWNHVSKDGQRSVLFSQMVLVEDRGAEVLTHDRR